MKKQHSKTTASDIRAAGTPACITQLKWVTAYLERRTCIRCAPPQALRGVFGFPRFEATAAPIHPLIPGYKPQKQLPTEPECRFFSGASLLVFLFPSPTSRCCGNQRGFFAGSQAATKSFTSYWQSTAPPHPSTPPLFK